MTRRRKPRRGPVPGTTGAGRTAVLRVRVTPEEHAAYVAAADRAGVPLPLAIRAATQNPADLLAITDRGRLRPGLRADLVLLDADLTVHATLLEGSWVDAPREL